MKGCMRMVIDPFDADPSDADGNWLARWSSARCTRVRELGLIRGERRFPLRSVESWFRAFNGLQRAGMVRFPRLFGEPWGGGVLRDVANKGASDGRLCGVGALGGRRFVDRTRR